MRRLLFFVFIFCFFSYYKTISQDIHLTYYQTNSPVFNPAQSGDFKGNTRVGGAFRTQYARTYEQGITHVDMNLFSPFNKKHWMSVGMQLIYDVSGSLRLSQAGGGLNIAYHLPFGKKDNQTISFGINVSLYSMGINTDQYRSETVIFGNSDPDLETLENFNGKAFSCGVGIRYKYLIDKKTTIYLGTSLLHLNEPEYSVISDKTFLGRRINSSILWSKNISPIWMILPGVNFSYTEKHTNTNLQFTNEYKLNKNNNWALIGGLSYRLGESMDLIVGYKSNRMMAALSVDVLTGKVADVVNNLGALELSAYYIFEKYVKPKTIPIILCPRI